MMVINQLTSEQAYWLIDRKGRRWLLLLTLPFLALAMTGAAASFRIEAGSRAQLVVMGIFTYIFIFFYSWGSKWSDIRDNI